MFVSLALKNKKTKQNQKPKKKTRFLSFATFSFFLFLNSLIFFSFFLCSLSPPLSLTHAFPFIILFVFPFPFLSLYSLLFCSWVFTLFPSPFSLPFSYSLLFLSIKLSFSEFVADHPWKNYLFNNSTRSSAPMPERRHSFNFLHSFTPHFFFTSFESIYLLFIIFVFPLFSSLPFFNIPILP